HLTKAGVRRPGVWDLRRVARTSLRKAVDALPAPVQVVEAVVLLVDDDDVVDPREAGSPLVVARKPCRCCDCGRGRHLEREGEQPATSLRHSSHLASLLTSRS